MTFVPDTDTNFQAYAYARSVVRQEDLDTWDLVFSQYFLNACSLGTTLVTNSGSAGTPNGTVASAIAAANAAALVGARTF